MSDEELPPHLRESLAWIDQWPAAKEGHDAYLAGVPMELCPHAGSNDPRRLDWRQRWEMGWWIARNIREIVVRGGRYWLSKEDPGER